MTACCFPVLYLTIMGVLVYNLISYQKHPLPAPGLNLPVISSLSTSLQVVLQGKPLLAIIKAFTIE